MLIISITVIIITWYSWELPSRALHILLLFRHLVIILIMPIRVIMLTWYSRKLPTSDFANSALEALPYFHMCVRPSVCQSCAISTFIDNLMTQTVHIFSECLSSRLTTVTTWTTLKTLTTLTTLTARANWTTLHNEKIYHEDKCRIRIVHLIIKAEKPARV